MCCKGSGQTLASPAAPGAAGERPWGPARCDSVSPVCPGSWSRPPGPAGSLVEGGARGQSDHGGETPSSPPLWEVQSAGFPAPHMVVGVKGARSPPPSSWVSPLSPCSVRVACTRSSREQPPWGPHFIAVESARAPRTDRDMDVGGCRQKLFNMLPGEAEGGRVPQGSLVPREALWWAGQQREQVGPHDPAQCNPGTSPPVSVGPALSHAQTVCWASEVGPRSAEQATLS